MKAIILAGGLGTRLQGVLPNQPKVMAPIYNKPFLAYLLDYLQEQGVSTVILCVYYLKEKIQSYFQCRYRTIDLFYCVEDKSLGTGGAIFNALTHLAKKETIFVLNGDSLLTLDYKQMLTQHQDNNSTLTLSLTSVENSSRYGRVCVHQDQIIAFTEKGITGPGLINAGIYLMESDLFSSFRSLPTSFSFENDFLVPFLHLLKPKAYISNGYFIDIGVPEDYYNASYSTFFLK